MTLGTVLPMRLYTEILLARYSDGTLSKTTTWLLDQLCVKALNKPADTRAAQDLRVLYDVQTQGQTNCQNQAKLLRSGNWDNTSQVIMSQ